MNTKHMSSQKKCALISTQSKRIYMGGYKLYWQLACSKLFNHDCQRQLEALKTNLR